MTLLRTSLRNFFAHKGRMVLSGLAVVLSVAFVCGTLVFTDTMTTTFDKLFADSSANVTVSPDDEEDDERPSTGIPATLPASVVEEAGRAEGAERAFGLAVSMAVTVVDSDNKSISPTTGAPTIATNWTELDERTMKLTSGELPEGPAEVAVDADTAKKHGLELGDELRTIAAPGDFTAKISGIVTFEATNPGAAVLYFDTAVVQERLLADPEAFTHVAVVAADGVSDELLKKQVLAAVGQGYAVQTQAEFTDELKADMGFLDVMKWVLLGFALIALLVGVFLIVNTFSMLVAQRTREIGLMRAIGADRRQVNRSVLVEAVLLGLFGSLVGVAAGVGLAVGLMALMNSFGMSLSTDDLTITWVTPVVGVALGVLVTVLAAYLPARRAGRVSPMAALRDSGVPQDGSAGRVRAVAGLVLTGGGALALLFAARADEAAPGALMLALGVLLSLVGFVLVGPLLASVVVRGLSVVVLRLWGPVGRLAERNALRNPRRTGATGAALMIGLALVASLSVVGASMVASADRELDRSVGADFIVSNDMGAPITPKAAEAVRSAPRLAHVTEYRALGGVEVTLPGGEEVRHDAVAASPTYAEDVRVETVEGRMADAYRQGAVSVDEAFADKHGLSVGDEVSLRYRDGDAEPLRIAAVTSKEASLDGGVMFLGIRTAETFVPEARMPLPMLMFGKAEEGQEAAAYQGLKERMEPFPQYQVRDQADYKAQLREQVGQLLNMVYGLLALAIIVAILGVVNTLALSVVERTREIGLMRAIGLSRRQLRRMIRLESVVIALFGALLGLGLGLVWGAAAQQLLALEGLRVLEIPWATIVTVFFGAAVVGLVAALVPAFRAGRMNVLSAIATE
ncbi:FtsX-like permease family protein [Streptomyces durbertensis]|uniref:FtsX-like permease family protein n=1 Tax=Streptomyces durbertensis TaxID=2448886 RepID=A0ABR6EH85_9ACTN|nr:ABC transporter permease [Streptomyces durbertensis]MBB1244685.1 FtsX-like permease family protein [Streptomyces durbertensis]